MDKKEKTFHTHFGKFIEKDGVNIFIPCERTVRNYLNYFENYPNKLCWSPVDTAYYDVLNEPDKTKDVSSEEL